MSHVTHKNESWVTYTSRTASTRTWVKMVYVTRRNESCHTQIWVMSQTKMSHDLYILHEPPPPEHEWKWFMSGIVISHVTHPCVMSCQTYEWFMSHSKYMSDSCHTGFMSHSKSKSCQTYEWFMSHIPMCVIHVTHMGMSRHTHEWVVSHKWVSHVTHMSVSCHTHEHVMSHTWVSHVTHTLSTYHLHLSHVPFISVSCHTHEWVMW